MPFPTTPIVQALQFAGTHSFALVTDRRLVIRFSPNGLEIVGENKQIAEHEQDLVMSLCLITSDNLDLLRLSAVLPSTWNNHGWCLDIIFS